jgi:hypothetical protein
MSAQPVRFDDLDDFDSLPKAAPMTPEVVQACPRCCGRGHVVYGYVNIRTYECGLCRGTGKVTAMRIKRVKAAKQARQTAANNRATRYEEFRKQYPAVFKFLQEKDFDFARSLRQQLEDSGKLSEKQIAAVYQCMARDEDRRQQNQAKQAARAVQLDDTAMTIVTSLQRALQTIKNPKMRTEKVIFTMAKPHSKNPGCVYVTARESDEYLGKIDPTGKFTPVRSCSDEQRDAVAEVAKDPMTAAKVYGMKFGICSCCGRELTDPASIAMGIGPICAGKYFG